MNKNEDFKLEVCVANGILDSSDPNYFNGRFVLEVENNKGTVEIEEKGYTLNNVAILELKNFAIQNMKKLEVLSEMEMDVKDGDEYSSIELTLKDNEIEIIGDVEEKAYKKVLHEFQQIVESAIEKGNAFVDENSPNPVKEAKECEQAAREKDLIKEQYVAAMFGGDLQRLNELKAKLAEIEAKEK